MKSMRTLGALLLAAGMALPAAAASDRYPSTTVIENVPSQVDADASLAGVQLFLPAGLDRQSNVQNGYAALVGEIVAQTPVASDAASVPLRDAIAARGANLSVVVEPQTIRYYVEGRPAATAAALALLANALKAPDFSHATLERAKASLRQRINEANASPFGVVSTMLRSSYYQGSGAGYAPMGSVAVIANATPDTVRAFWSDYYRSGGAYLSAAGRVDESVIRAARAALASLPSGAPAPLELKTRKPSDPPARIITHRDVGLPWIGIGFQAPAAGSRDFAAMLVASAIIASLGRTDAIVSRPAALRPINVVYQYDVRPANLIVYSSGSSLSSPTGLREIFAATDVLSAKPLDASVIGRYRTLAIGQFVMDNISLEDRSALIGLCTRLGLDADYANSLLGEIAAVTPADVQRVAKAYMQKYTVAIILPRTAQPQRDH